MLNLGLSSDALQIDPAEYEDRPETAALARVISTAIEAERARRRATEPMIEPFKTGLSVGGLLGGGQAYHLCDRTPWHEVLLVHEVLRDCAQALGINLTELLHRIIHELLPPNWQAFFWMKAYLESVPAEYHHAMVNLVAETAAQAEAKRIKQTRATRGGLGKAKKKEPAKALVVSEWEKHGVTGYGGNKSEFARVYVRRVKNELGTDITEKTIRETWLRGL